MCLFNVNNNRSGMLKSTTANNAPHPILLRRRVSLVVNLNVSFSKPECPVLAVLCRSALIHLLLLTTCKRPVARTRLTFTNDPIRTDVVRKGDRLSSLGAGAHHSISIFKFRYPVHSIEPTGLTGRSEQRFLSIATAAFGRATYLQNDLLSAADPKRLFEHLR